MSDRPPTYTDLADAATCGVDEARRRYTHAIANQQAVNARWENYSGNNPNKYRGAIKNARFYVSQWQYYLAQIYKVSL